MTINNSTSLTPKRGRVRFFAVIVIGTTTVFFLLFFAGFGNVAEALVQARKDYLLLAFSITMLALAVRGVRWSFYLRKVGCRTKSSLVFSTLLAGCFFENVTPARVGEFFRPLILRSKDKTAISLTLPTVIVERILDLSISSLIAFLGIILLFSHLQPSILLALTVGSFIMVILIGLVFYLPRVLGSIISQGMKVLKALKMGWREDLQDELLNATNSMRKDVYTLLRDKVATLSGLALTIVLWLLNGFRLCLVLGSLGLSISLLQATVVVVFTVLVAIASMLPFGYGSAEFAMVFILTSLGFPFALSTVAAIIDKFLAIWFVALVGAIAGSGLGYSELLSKKDRNTSSQIKNQSVA